MSTNLINSSSSDLLCWAGFLCTFLFLKLLHKITHYSFKLSANSL